MSRKNVQKNLVQKKLGVKKQVLKKLGVKKQVQKKPFLVYYTPSFFYTWFFLHLQKCHFFGQKSKNRCRKNQKSRCRIGHFRQVQNRPGVEKTGCRIVSPHNLLCRVETKLIVQGEINNSKRVLIGYREVPGEFFVVVKI